MMLLSVVAFAEGYQEIFPRMNPKLRPSSLDWIASYAKEQGMQPLKQNHMRFFDQPLGIIGWAVDIDLTTGRLIRYPGTQEKGGHLEISADTERLEKLNSLLRSDAFGRLPQEGPKLGLDGYSYIVEVDIDGTYSWEFHWVPDDKTFGEIAQLLEDMSRSSEPSTLQRQ